MLGLQGPTFRPSKRGAAHIRWVAQISSPSAARTVWKARQKLCSIREPGASTSEPASGLTHSFRRTASKTVACSDVCTESNRGVFAAADTYRIHVFIPRHGTPFLRDSSCGVAMGLLLPSTGTPCVNRDSFCRLNVARFAVFGKTSRRLPLPLYLDNKTTTRQVFKTQTLQRCTLSTHCRCGSSSRHTMVRLEKGFVTGPSCAASACARAGGGRGATRARLTAVPLTVHVYIHLFPRVGTEAESGDESAEGRTAGDTSPVRSRIT